MNKYNFQCSKTLIFMDLWRKQKEKYNINNSFIQNMECGCIWCIILWIIKNVCIENCGIVLIFCKNTYKNKLKIQIKLVIYFHVPYYIFDSQISS